MPDSTPEAPRSRPLWRRVLGWTLLALMLAAVIVTVEAWPSLGGEIRGARLERVQRSPQYGAEGFENVIPAQADGFSLGTAWDFFTDATPAQFPDAPLATVTREATDFSAPRQRLRVTWLGHSTLLVELDSARILIDPVWGERVSPSRWIGTRRFAPPPLALDALPPLDAVLISHDHYDHLDTPTVRALAGRVPRWIVPLGIGAHLEAWGIAPEAITELDWWETAEASGVTLVSTPARHFSGRFVNDRDATLWTGWAILGESERVFYSGDTALTPSFAEIGRRYGPFDLTLIESGAYNEAWADVHLGPEQAIAVHRMVRGRVMMPVHWAMFDLSVHGWTEPAERVRAAAEQLGIPVAFPRPGESVTPEAYRTQPWWPDLPWKTAAESPAISSGLPDSVRALVPGP
ncbi:MBL fold metallo-hydrolase [Rubricoccus marinus]|nr:MBL fold metallo-hydrolase [Rubricoccus marinus]